MKLYLAATACCLALSGFGQNVGIGTASPAARLSVSATGSDLAGVAMSTTLRTNAGNLAGTVNSELRLANFGFMAGTNNTSLGIRAYRTGATSDWNTTSLLLEYDVDNTPRPSGGFLALSNNGRVGINNANPASPLDVSGGNWDLVNGEGDFRIGNDAYRLKMGIATGGGGAGAATIMVQGQNGAYNVLSLGSQGNKILYLNGAINAVGIGTDAPAGKLEIVSTSGTPQLLITQGSTGDFGRIRMKNGNTAGNGRVWDIAGFISGTTADGDRLNFFNTGGGNVLGLAGNGALYVNGNAGSAGQVLRSAGAGGPAAWTNTDNAFYYFTCSDSRNDITGIANVATVNIGGIDAQTITVTRRSAVVVTCKITPYNFNNFGGGIATAILRVSLMNGATPIASDGVYAMFGNAEQPCMTSQFVLDNVNPGTYTIAANLQKGYGDDIGFGSYYQANGTTAANMVVQVIAK